MNTHRLKTILLVPVLLITLLCFFGAANLSADTRLQGFPEPPEGGCKEDINKDEIVNIVDVVALLIMGRDDPESPVADYTDDGECNILDVTSLLLNIMKGNLTELEFFSVGGRVVANGEGLEGIIMVLETGGLEEGEEAMAAVAAEEGEEGEEDEEGVWVQDTTDSAGMYRFELIDGIYELKPIIQNWYYNFEPDEFEVIINGDSIILQDIEATLASNVLSGRVLEDSIGLGDVAVSVKGVGVDTTLVTDSLGTYRVEGLFNAPYVIMSTKENYTFAPYSLVVKMEGDSIAPDIMATPAGPSPVELYTIGGRVHCTVGPLANVMVVLTGPVEASTITGGNGNYTFLVPNGEYFVHVIPIPQFQVFIPPFINVTVNGEDVLNQDFFGYGAGGGVE